MFNPLLNCWEMEPREEKCPAQGFPALPQLEQTRLPSPPPAQGSGPHFRGSRVLGSHTRVPASCLPEAHPCLLPTHTNTSGRAHTVTRVGPSAANTKHTTI